MADLTQFARDISAPARGAFAITKSDSLVFDNAGGDPPPARAIYVGGTGDLVVRFVDGSIVTFVGVPAGSLLPIHVDQVRAATTATNILGLF
jgi:hypothetical protein